MLLLIWGRTCQTLGFAPINMKYGGIAEPLVDHMFAVGTYVDNVRICSRVCVAVGSMDLFY